MDLHSGQKNTENFIHNYTLYILNLWVGWTVKLRLNANIKRDKWSVLFIYFLCFFDRASLYNLVNKANLVHNYS